MTHIEPTLNTLHFSIDHWDHLYSLHKAIEYNQQQTGRMLTIKGTIRNQALLEHQDHSITIEFLQSSDTPSYSSTEFAGQTRPVLGNVTRKQQALTSCITVDCRVFEELRKNLMEYADIDGIHIVVSLGLLCPPSPWVDGQSLQLIELDYAMRGDA